MTPIDTTTNTAGTAITVGSAPIGIAITPDLETAYVVNWYLDDVTPIHVASDTAGPTIPVGTNPAGIAITPNGNTAYVTDQGGLNIFSGTGPGGVTPIDTATNTSGPSFSPLGDLTEEGIAIPSDSAGYVADGAAYFWSFSPSTNQLVGATGWGSADLGPWEPGPVAVTPDGKTAYVGTCVEQIFQVGVCWRRPRPELGVPDPPPHPLVL